MLRCLLGDYNGEKVASTEGIMPFQLSWYFERRILYQRVYGDVTPEEMVQTNATLIEHLRAGDSPVHLLLDLTQMGKFPTNFL